MESPVYVDQIHSRPSKAISPAKSLKSKTTPATTLIDAEVAETADAPAKWPRPPRSSKARSRSSSRPPSPTASPSCARNWRRAAPAFPARGDDERAKTFRVPATVKRYSSLKNFTGPSTPTSGPSASACSCLGVYGRKSAVEFCQKQGIPLRAMTSTPRPQRENVNASSGFLVPDEFQNDLIDLREKYGVFRQNAKIVPMASDTRSDPRRVNGVTAYFVGESAAATLSDKSWDRVRLTAKKLMVLTKYSNELNEDAVLNIGDDLAGEIAYAFALKEDQCGFLGDGTSTYGGIVGVTTRAAQRLPRHARQCRWAWSPPAAPATPTSYSAITLGDFNRVVGTLPEYADVPGETQVVLLASFSGAR